MKFSITRKINLSNIDKELWPYETEDIGVSDADSFEEAQQKADHLVAERTGYYKSLSDLSKAKKAAPAPLPIQPAATPVAPAPTAPVQAPVAAPPATPAGVSATPPAEFNQ